ncbi:MAG: hypothetical protein AB7S78_13480 [Candidatus Omnitrophota bacterium]
MPKPSGCSPWAQKACLLLTIVFGLVYLAPFVNYQPFLSTGDHGLNLYNARAVLAGQRPYHDFHWFYGPLMLYYSAFCLKIFGIGIQGILMGSVILKLISGLLVFALCSLYISPFLAFGAAAWFWLFNFDFFYTYNHTGGITLSLAVLYCLFLHFKSDRLRYLILGSLACAGLGMIKVNLGFCGIFCLNAGAVLNRLIVQKKFSPGLTYYLAASSLVLPVFVIAANWMFIIGLPFYVIRQCYQYFGNDTQAWEYTSPLQAVVKLKDYLVGRVGPHKDLAAFSLASAGALIFFVIQTARSFKRPEHQREGLLVITTVVMFTVCFLHEYLLSGVIFRAFWAQPFLFVLMFLSIGLAAAPFPRRVQSIVFLILFALIGTRGAQKTVLINSLKNRDQFLALERANIYVGNSHDWIYTVTRAARYLEKNLGPDDSIFVLPYDPLYYFLLDKPSPTRQLAILSFVNIPDEQERSIVDDLKKNKPQWVLLSNRAAADLQGTGQLGVTYGKMIGQYIKENYSVEKEFGNWDGVAGWTSNHAVRILRRTP